MDEAEFDKKFTFKQNHIVPSNEDKFETYGPELDFVQLPENKNHVWTAVDGDEGELVYVSGFHYVNRIFYMISNESHNGEDISVTIEMDEEER